MKKFEIHSHTPSIHISLHLSTWNYHIQLSTFHRNNIQITKLFESIVTLIDIPNRLFHKYFLSKKRRKKTEKNNEKFCQWVRGKWWIMESINGCERIFVNFMVDRMLDLCERCVFKNKWHFVFKISLLLSVKPFKIIIFFTVNNRIGCGPSQM